MRWALLLSDLLGVEWGAAPTAPPGLPTTTEEPRVPARELPQEGGPGMGQLRQCHQRCLKGDTSPHPNTLCPCSWGPAEGVFSVALGGSRLPASPPPHWLGMWSREGPD